ncbi:aldo/keto reductase [Hyunsoonleella aquatilis]|nr:aldo/keto reductase [Hyunsoonleella aquatilis]
MNSKIYTRREMAKLTGLSALGLLMSQNAMSFNLSNTMLKRSIFSSNEKLPVIGLGTWQTFDVKSSPTVDTTLVKVLEILREQGGSVIDTSPMYGRSEEVVGDLTKKMGIADDYFYATKVWTSGKEKGIQQMEKSFQLMRRKQMDLMQIHNLVDWETHVKTLRDWKEKGKIRYWGITHYLDSAHEALEKVIQAEKPDFVQFNYSIRNRHAEKSLFHTIEKNGTAVLINRPFESGSLFGKTKGKPMPLWCLDYDIKSWGQFFLKFILSNELVTCVIPGTSKPKHALDNMMAGFGRMPDTKTRENMYSLIKNL